MKYVFSIELNRWIWGERLVGDGGEREGLGLGFFV